MNPATVTRNTLRISCSDEPCNCYTQDASRLPGNPAMEGITDAIASAASYVEMRNNSAADGISRGVVVMVVQPGERNAYDQQVGALVHAFISVRAPG